MHVVLGPDPARPPRRRSTGHTQRHVTSMRSTRCGLSRLPPPPHRRCTPSRSPTSLCPDIAHEHDTRHHPQGTTTRSTLQHRSARPCGLPTRTHPPRVRAVCSVLAGTPAVRWMGHCRTAPPHRAYLPLTLWGRWYSLSTPSSPSPTLARCGTVALSPALRRPLRPRKLPSRARAFVHKVPSSRIARRGARGRTAGCVWPRLCAPRRMPRVHTYRSVSVFAISTSAFV
ncbi:hypothetical protein B0H10DRAFT_905169 [Mycena sp. CBHHK59/15]|nr:hypothetical protein B0H10DRAFT_905071 [Mycena sp. CBHHK59/15]KAJ6580309.1 hypothetical protein B0H10DRAFT_905169 [Mycena sp. CBHHK59/15]